MIFDRDSSIVQYIPTSKHTLFVTWLSDVPPRTDLLCRSVQRYGFQTSFITWAEGHQLYAQLNNLQKKIRVRTPIFIKLKKWFEMHAPFFRHGLVTLPVQYIEYTCRVRKVLLGIIRDKNIIVLTHPFLLTLVPTLKKAGAHVYYDCMEFEGMMMNQKGFVGKGFAKLYDFLENRYVPRLAGVLCVTSRDGWLKKRLTKLNPKTIELWNLPPRSISIDKKLLDKLQAQFAGRDIITYIGGLHAQKGLRVFPEMVRLVVREHKQAHFLIIGRIRAKEGPEGWLEKTGIHKYCTYVPWVAQDILFTYLQVSDIGLVLSWPEGIHLHMGPGNGRKVFTYFAAGVPVVAPQHSTAWNLVTDEKTGIQVDTTNPAAIADGISQLLADRRARNAMGQRALELFRQKYHWESQEQGLLKLFAGNAS